MEPHPPFSLPAAVLPHLQVYYQLPSGFVMCLFQDSHSELAVAGLIIAHQACGHDGKAIGTQPGVSCLLSLHAQQEAPSASVVRPPRLQPPLLHAWHLPCHCNSRLRRQHPRNPPRWPSPDCPQVRLAARPGLRRGFVAALQLLAFHSPSSLCLARMRTISPVQQISPHLSMVEAVHSKISYYIWRLDMRRCLIADCLWQFSCATCGRQHVRGVQACRDVGCR